MVFMQGREGDVLRRNDMNAATSATKWSSVVTISEANHNGNNGRNEDLMGVLCRRLSDECFVRYDVFINFVAIGNRKKVSSKKIITSHFFIGKFSDKIELT